MKFRTFVASAVVIGIGTVAFAGGHGGNPAVKARKAHMQLQAHNLGILGGMAKGEIEYNADAASAAANNLAALSEINQMSYWAPGTSNADLGEETRALPAIWEDGSNVMEIVSTYDSAVVELAAVAGNGQEALGPAVGAVGKQCGACHEKFRQSDN